MSPLQFSLFFAALLVAYVLVHLRLVRFERYLKEIAGLRTTNERLQGLSKALEGFRLDAVERRLDRSEELLDRIHGELEELVGAAGRLERRSAQAERVVPRPAVAPVDTDRIRAAVESALQSLGYRSVRILTDLADLPADREAEVVVECFRGQMPHKGRVLVAEGTVRDVDLRSVAQAFP